MFSSTMIASSITMPTASVNASRVILLSEKSMYRISVNVAIMEVGMARAAINTARQLRMNSSTTRLARKLPRTRCSSSECTEALMKTEMSWTTSRWTPGGSSSFRVSSRRLTLSATRTVFVPDCRSTETLTASRGTRSEEHTSELQSLAYLVCRLLLEKKKERPRALVTVIG